MKDTIKLYCLKAVPGRHVFKAGRLYEVKSYTFDEDTKTGEMEIATEIRGGKVKTRDFKLVNGAINSGDYIFKQHKRIER